MTSLKLEEYKPATLLPGHVRVEVEAWGVDPSDITACLRCSSITPPGRFTPGFEFTGHVVEVYNDGDGEDKKKSKKRSRPTAAAGFYVGQKVMGLTHFGGYSTHVSVDARLLRARPSQWSLDQSATCLFRGIQAYHGLFERCGLKLDDDDATTIAKTDAEGSGAAVASGAAVPTQHRRRRVVLVQSATDSGALALHMALMASNTAVIATVHSQAAKESLLKQHHHQLKDKQIIVTSDVSVFGSLLDVALDSIDAKKVDIVVDYLCDDSILQQMSTRLNPYAHVLYLGCESVIPRGDSFWSPSSVWKWATTCVFQRPKVDVLDLITHNRSFHSFSTAMLLSEGTDTAIETLSSLMDKLIAFIDAFPADIPTAAVVRESFDDLPKALKMWQDGVLTGQLCLVPKK